MDENSLTYNGDFRGFRGRPTGRFTFGEPPGFSSFFRGRPTGRLDLGDTSGITSFSDSEQHDPFNLK